MKIVQHKSQRVGVFVDVQNLYYSAKKIYHKKVNFTNLLKESVKGRQLIRAIAYVIKADMKDEANFHEALTKIGYEVKSKDLQVFYGGAKKGDWDVGIAMDMIRLADKIDCAILVSGDGDYQDLLEYLKAKGCRTEVVALGKTCSNRLREECDSFLDLESDTKKFLASSTTKKKGPKQKSSKKDTPKEEVATETDDKS